MIQISTPSFGHIRDCGQMYFANTLIGALSDRLIQLRAGNLAMINKAKGNV